MLDFALKNRWLVLIGLLGLVLGGLYTMIHLNIEAYPDLTNIQVVVTTEAPGMSPVEVEQTVTFPVESTLIGMPKTQVVRSISKLGLSMITVVFDDSMDLYLARQLVNERIGEARGSIPAGLQPRLGPLATAFGEVYQYTLQGGNNDLMQLKTLQDWSVRYSLRTIAGVSEINSWGGYTKQYVVEVNPLALRRYDLTVHDLVTRVTDNNTNFGGGFIEHAEQQYTIRGLGRAAGITDLQNIVVRSNNGIPVLLRDVAEVKTAPMPRQGAVMQNGRGETVSGMVIITKGTNSRNTIEEIKKRVANLKLPNGVKLSVFYDQSTVVDATIETVKHNLIEAGVLVLVILLIFLGDWRAAFLVALVIPLSLLFGFIGMAVFHVSANLMSLGAVDFGMIVDGAVVMVENSVRRLNEGGEGKKAKGDIISQATHEVARPIVFGVAIIIAVYLPIFTLQGLEGRMFHPMAITVCSALAGSLLVALFGIPALSTYALKPKQEKHGKRSWLDRVRGGYERCLDWVLGHRAPVLVVAAVAFLIAAGSLKFIGTEFMPKLDEGSIVVTSRRLPGISLGESIFLGNQIEKTILSFPEVKRVVTKLGRPDLATEAMSIYESDSYLTLAPKNEWKCCKDKGQLVQKLNDSLDQQIPGVGYTFTQPMEMRMDEVVTGIRGDVALKIFGPDTDILDHLASRAVHLIGGVKGAAEVQKDSSSGVPNLHIEVNRAEMDRYGLNVSDVQDLVETMLGGKQASEMVSGEQRFAIVVRLPTNQRNNVDALGRLFLVANNGARVQLDQVATLRTVYSAEIINRENAQRRVAVQASVRGRDLGGFVNDAQTAVASGMKLPPGYTLMWGGQFENQQRADQRLLIVFPVSILIIFGLLYATFQNAKQALLILLIVPFAFVGGIAALWIRGLNLSLSASVGFIALFGVAVLNGVVMVSHINSLRGEHDVKEAVKEGAKDRLRPVLMTALVASLGFIPMATATSIGAEVQRPLATVVIGGLITATVLTLFLLPMMYPTFSKKDPAQQTGG